MKTLSVIALEASIFLASAKPSLFTDLSAARQTAADAVETWKTGNSAAFIHSDKTHYANRLKELVTAPERINQGMTGLCGPASFLYCVCFHKPDVFAKFGMDLFDTGRASIGALMIGEGSIISSFGEQTEVLVFDLQMSRVCDLVLLAAFVSHTASSLESIKNKLSTPGLSYNDITNWVNATGLFKPTAYTTADRSDPIGDLNTQYRQFASTIILDIDSDIIDNTPIGFISRSDHVVVLVSTVAPRPVVNNDPTKTMLDIVTWGRYRILNPSKQDFIDAYDGRIIVMPL